MRILWIAMLALALPGAVAAQVGTATVTTSAPEPGYAKFSIDWTSDASGDVNTNPFDVGPGWLVTLHIMPDSGGTQPTDQYDITLDDDDDVDWADGQAANLSNATGLLITWQPPVYFDGTDQIDLVVSNAGNAKGGVVELVVQR